MPLWEKEKRVNAQELIDWLLSRRTEPGGWPVEWVTTVAFAELGSSSSKPRLMKTLVMQVLNEMCKNGKKSVMDFETIFDNIQKAKITNVNQETGNWHFFIPIKVKINSDVIQKPQIRILGKRFTFISLPLVKRKLDPQSRTILDNPNTISLNTGVKVERLPEVFLSVSGKASDFLLAWEDIAPAFDALRGLIESTLSFYRGRISWGKESARREIPHPLWLIAYKKGIPPEWLTFVTEEDNTTKMFDLTDARLTLIKKNSEILKEEPKPKSTLSIIADCLRLYSQAMDANFNHLCFLGFWQLAEAITHSETVGGKTDKVVARISWHGIDYGLKGSGYKETLLALGERRNDIVHRGIHEIDDDDINILKAACEIALDWLFRVRKSLPTVAHIEHYYRLREMHVTDLKAIKDCVVYVEKQKNK